MWSSDPFLCHCQVIFLKFQEHFLESERSVSKCFFHKAFSKGLWSLSTVKCLPNVY